MKWFGMASLAMASESEQCYSSRGPLAASLCQKPSCFNWKIEKFTKLMCARKMIWVHMGFPWFPDFSQDILQFLYVCFPTKTHMLIMISRDPLRMRCWRPRLGTWPRLLSIRGEMPTGAPSVNVCNCNICNTTVNAIQHPVLDTIGGIPNRIPLAFTTSFNHPNMAVVGWDNRNSSHLCTCVSTIYHI